MKSWFVTVFFLAGTSFPLSLNSIFGQNIKNKSEEIRLELIKNFQNLGSFEADFLAAKSENNHRVHIRLINNTKEKYILYKVNNINSSGEKQDLKSDQRTYIMLDYSRALTQYYIFPDKKEIWRYSTDDMLHDPFNVFMTGINVLHHQNNDDNLVMRFNLFAPIFNLELKEAEIQCFLGVDVLNAKASASWLKAEVFDKAHSVEEKNGQYTLYDGKQHWLTLDQNGMYVGETLRYGQVQRTITRQGIRYITTPKEKALANMAMYQVKNQYHPEFKRSLLSIMTYLSGVYLSQYPQDVKDFYTALAQKSPALKNQVKKWQNAQLLNMASKDKQFTQFLLHLIYNVLVADFEKEKPSENDFHLYLRQFKQNYTGSKKVVAETLLQELVKLTGENWAVLEAYEPYIQSQEMSMQFSLREFYKNFYPLYIESFYEAFIEAVIDYSLSIHKYGFTDR